MSFASERNMEPPNLDFSDFGLENFVVMFMIYRLGLVGRFFSYVISKAGKYFR